MDTVEIADRIASEIRLMAVKAADRDSELLTETLRNLLVDFADEIKRTAIEP